MGSVLHLAMFSRHFHGFASATPVLSVVKNRPDVERTWRDKLY